MWISTVVNNVDTVESVLSCGKRQGAMISPYFLYYGQEGAISPPSVRNNRATFQAAKKKK